MGKLLHLLRSAALVTLCLAALSCSKDSTNNPTPPGPTPGPGPGPAPTHEDAAINQKMDAILKEMYFYNTEYKTLTPNYAQAYNSYLPSLLLNQMTTNIYDRKQSNGTYRIYSYIQRLGAVGATQLTRGVNHGVIKEAQNSFGIARMTVFNFTNSQGQPNGTMGFAVSAVYPGSPADLAGIKRGFIVTKVDGQTITSSNYISSYYAVTSPSSAGKQLVLTEGTSGSPTKTLISKSLFPNPVLKAKVYTQGDKKIGYIVYEGFDAAYDDELLAAIKTVKDGGANELIVDLRFNGGGYVISSNMFSTCIAGSKSNGKVYQYYKYNADRMAKAPQSGMGPYDSSKKLYYDSFYYGDYYSVDLRSYALNMNRIYVLVSSDTASASEALFGSLRGIDIPVTLIGPEKTSGKNTGMETQQLSDSRYNYHFAPVTFESFNAKQVAINYLGETPDEVVSDWSNGYIDFGEMNEPLFAKAYQLITGITPAAAAVPTRADGVRMEIVDMDLPSTNLSRQGMQIIVPQAE